ncbi:hypothetical protein MD484_g7056, partial [Candolleomyces efflorescens]
MADSVVILDTIPANLKTSSPSLMPFHISYSGPAAISTFMDVKPAKEEKMGAQSQPPPCNSAEVGEPEAVGQYQPDLARATMSVDDGATGDPLEEPPTTSTRKRGRLTRSAVSKRVVDVEAEEAKKAKEAAAAAIDVDAHMDVDSNEDEFARDNAPQRRLKPVSEFSSFTIWHADNPVIENQDEYYRSMHEWTALAAAVHQVDDETEA